MNPRNFFAELKRRNVYKVAVVYAVVGWLLVQIATQVFPLFEIPNWAVRLVVLLVVIGFPVALLLAWRELKAGTSRCHPLASPISRGRRAKAVLQIYSEGLFQRKFTLRRWRKRSEALLLHKIQRFK